MAAHTWELDRDLNLARWAGDQAAVQRLEAVLDLARQACAHVPNPERPERCYKCGISPVPVQAPSVAPEPRPGPAKVRRSPLSIQIKKLA